MLMPGKNHNVSKNFELHENEKSILEKQNIKRDYRDLVSKFMDTESCEKNSLSKHTSQNKFFVSELSSFLREIRFSKQEVFASKIVSDIK